jgi:hypothetical protein
MPSDQPEFGRLVQQAMHAKGLTYAQLVARLALETDCLYTRTMVRRIVLGHRPASATQVEHLIAALSPELDANAARAAAVS